MPEPTTTLAFRVATPADIPAVVALVESAYRGDASRAGWTTEADLLDGQRTDAEEVRSLVADPDGHIILATAEGELVGCCHLRTRPGGPAYFGMFAVRPELQGHGTGRALLAEAEAQAAAAGASRLQMTVLAQRPDLIAWYERLGYRRTGRQVPFPHGDERFGRPRRPDLVFDELDKELA
ncbi:MAG TPA: GNAT family N-acetyltransferase [Acidimicrobiales bacterium]|nr:GNAT family N-acetyltransferase [Acidimicrobiales bacterium]